MTRRSARRPSAARRFCIGMALLTASCAAPPPAAPDAALPTPPTPVRFLLSFDDGPAGTQRDNPTQAILDALADNPVQPGIRAIFFVQTRSRGGGATERGRELMREEDAQGHVVALHNGLAAHRDQRRLDDAMLEQCLADGVSDIQGLLGGRVALTRPPYWAFDQRTLAAYARHGLAMLLTDVSANDGKTFGFRSSPRRYVHLETAMAHERERLLRGELPQVDGVVPVVVTFHDTNTYTAAHMREYLQMLVQAAHAAGVPTADPPYYSDRAALQRAGLARAARAAGAPDMVPWWWRWLPL